MLVWILVFLAVIAIVTVCRMHWSSPIHFPKWEYDKGGTRTQGVTTTVILASRRCTKCTTSQIYIPGRGWTTN